MSRVVVPVLATGSAMQVNHDHNAVVPRPADGVVEVLGLTLVVRLPGRDVVRPVTDRDTDVVQPGGCGR
jgi:hypothetical protein